MKKNVYIHTFGCQMNERDSEGVRGLLAAAGHSFTDEPGEADVILYNTCSVRQHAEERVYGRLGTMKKDKAERPGLKIGILGCMAQEHGNRFFKRVPHLDFVCGPGNLHELPSIFERLFNGERHIAAVDKIDEPESPLNTLGDRTHPVRTAVNIMSGCEHRCTYCIVPKTRGVERSRPSADIVSEIRLLVGQGYKDITLLGQNVNCYGRKLDEGIDFVALLEKIQAEAAPERLRFMSSHPKDAHLRLFEAMRDLPCVCEHLHLPVQSGSDRVLKRMKREHTREWYLDRITEYRRTIPGGSLTTDVIVGFCGESDKDFEDTRLLMREAAFDSSFIFKYSPREGTPAYKLPDDVPEEVKRSRLAQMLILQRELTAAAGRAYVGRTEEVLFEDDLREGRPSSAGRNRQFRRIIVPGEQSLASQLRNVIIRRSTNETLVGELAV